MAKFRYNRVNLSFERIDAGWKYLLVRGAKYGFMGLLFAAAFIGLTYWLHDSPKEKYLKREIALLAGQYDNLSERILLLSGVLKELQERDKNIYRAIFEAQPIAEEVREAGFGGASRYEKLKGYDNSALMIYTTRELDKLTRRMNLQSLSFDALMELARNKSDMLASIPAIQPIANKDLTRVASGFGNRIHPIYKTQKMHTGMDFTAPRGTEVYATGNGTVVELDRAMNGYGKHVVLDHSFGYRTLYGHLDKIVVLPGQKVKRGEVIGYVGTSGASLGPHLHYEVIKNGEKIDPVNFFYNDLTPEEYERMIEISSRLNQSFD